MAISTRPEYVIARAKSAQRIARHSFPATPFPHSMLLQFKKYDYKNLDAQYNNKVRLETIAQTESASTGNGLRVDLKEEATIELPFPTQLVDAISVNISGTERGLITDKVANAIGNSIGSSTSLKDVPSILAKELANMGGMAMDMISGMADGGTDGLSAKISKVLESINVGNAAQAATYLLSSIDPSIGQAVSRITGKTLNPRETLAFNGVNLKTYSFSWSLFPSNPADSQQIKQIIALLKKNALPETESIPSGDGAAGNNAVSRIFLKYPAVVECTLLGVDPSFFPRFKPMMITGITINYSGGGGVTSILKEGRPAILDLSLDMTELSIETADDIISEPDTAEMNENKAENPADGT